MTLLERHPNAPAHWKGNLPVTSRYTFGLAGERFFRAIKDEGKILGTYCPDCDWTYVPAAVFCERCMSPLNEWVDVGTTGEVHTFTLLFEEYDGTPRSTPEVVAFIQFGDGGLVHKLGEYETEDIYFGIEVEAVFKPPEERVGSISDIEYFKPV